MATDIKTNWMQDFNGDLFAPKTLIDCIQDNDGTSLKEYIDSHGGGSIEIENVYNITTTHSGTTVADIHIKKYIKNELIKSLDMSYAETLNKNTEFDDIIIYYDGSPAEWNVYTAKNGIYNNTFYGAGTLLIKTSYTSDISEQIIYLKEGSSISASDILYDDSETEMEVENVQKAIQWLKEHGGGGEDPYELPIASETVLGGIKIGKNLSIDTDGTLNANDVIEIETQQEYNDLSIDDKMKDIVYLIKENNKIYYKNVNYGNNGSSSVQSDWIETDNTSAAYIKNKDNVLSIANETDIIEDASISTIVDSPFRFGIDENGNYGYYKDGADTVTPFKTGGSGGTGLKLSDGSLYGFSGKVEGSMSFEINDTNIKSIWNKGQQIGGYIRCYLNFTNLSKITLKYDGIESYSNTYGQTSRNDWAVMLCVVAEKDDSFNPTTYYAKAFDGTIGNDKTLEIDVSQLTGRYQLRVMAHGWTTNINDIILS